MTVDQQILIESHTRDLSIAISNSQLLNQNNRISCRVEGDNLYMVGEQKVGSIAMEEGGRVLGEGVDGERFLG